MVTISGVHLWHTRADLVANPMALSTARSTARSNSPSSMALFRSDVSEVVSSKPTTHGDNFFCHLFAPLCTFNPGWMQDIAVIISIFLFLPLHQPFEFPLAFYCYCHQLDTTSSSLTADFLLWLVNGTFCYSSYIHAI